jgi:hypothetical protein
MTDAGSSGPERAESRPGPFGNVGQGRVFVLAAAYDSKGAVPRKCPSPEDPRMLRHGSGKALRTALNQRRFSQAPVPPAGREGSCPAWRRCQPLRASPPGPPVSGACRRTCPGRSLGRSSYGATAASRGRGRTGRPPLPGRGRSASARLAGSGSPDSTSEGGGAPSSLPNRPPLLPRFSELDRPRGRLTGVSEAAEADGTGAARLRRRLRHDVIAVRLLVRPARSGRKPVKAPRTASFALAGGKAVRRRSGSQFPAAC